MGIDRRHVGFALPRISVVVSEERVQEFATAIGETVPVTTSQLIPLTFLKVIEGEGASSRRMVEELGVDLRRILHAEQHFEYLAPLKIGDAISVERRIAEIYEKKGGEMEFVVFESMFFDTSETLVAKSKQIILVRNKKSEHRDGN